MALDPKQTAPVVKTWKEYLPEPYVEGDGGDGTYYGYAPMGVGENEEGWMIIKIVIEDGVRKPLYAQGSKDFISAWSQRANYEYRR